MSWSSLDTGGISMESKTTTIRAIKQEVRLQEWSAQIEAQQASVMTVQQWCAQNAVNPKTYYYHLKKVRAQYLESAPSIVPLTAPHISYPYRKERIANSPAGLCGSRNAAGSGAGIMLRDLTAGTQVYLVTGHTDLRRSIDGLAEIYHEEGLLKELPAEE